MPEKIKIGKIVNAVGIAGEVKVYNYSDSVERFSELKYLYLDERDEKITVKSVRYMKNTAILKLQGINDRNDAEALKNRAVYIDESQLRKLDSDTYYIRDLIGMQVRTADGEKIGELSDVIKGAAQDLYEVRNDEGKKFLIPAVNEFVKDINLDERIIEVSLIEGLLDL